MRTEQEVRRAKLAVEKMAQWALADGAVDVVEQAIADSLILDWVLGEGGHLDIAIRDAFPETSAKVIQ